MRPEDFRVFKKRIYQFNHENFYLEDKGLSPVSREEPTPSSWQLVKIWAMHSSNEVLLAWSIVPKWFIPLDYRIYIASMEYILVDVTPIQGVYIYHDKELPISVLVI